MSDAPGFFAEKGSFRDRNNQVFLSGDHVYRGISDQALTNWRQLNKSAVYRKFNDLGYLVGTRQVDKTDGAKLDETEAGMWPAILEHDRIPFINYAYEWCFQMLKDAALLHLDLLEGALQENLILKDSSMFNIHFVGARPVFIDIPSFEVYEPGMPWVGFRQFCQHFLYPLMLQSYKNISMRSWLRGNVEGITPHECNQLMSMRDLFRRGVFSLVYLQSKLVDSMGDAKTSILAEARDSEFGKEIVLVNVRKMRKIINGLEWRLARSEWSEYKQTHSYDAACFDAKCTFVQHVAAARHRSNAWDIGCNTGHFSRMLAQHTDYVVAMDIDELSIQRLYSELKLEGVSNILPLVFDLTNPSPRLGWRCEERLSLADRQPPELILCLALVHHLVITGNVPLGHVLDWLASFKCEVVIEMLTKEDPMVKKLLLNRVDQYDEFTMEGFERIAARYFRTVDKLEVMADKRFLYHLAPLQD